MSDSEARPLALHVALAAMALVPIAAAHADCQPSKLLDINPGSSIVCAGFDADGFFNPAYDIVLDADGNEMVTERLVDSLSVLVSGGATVSGGEGGTAIMLVNGGHSVVNNGTLTARYGGLTGFGGSVTATNNGEVIVGGADGGVGFGFSGSNLVISNTSSGSIRATGAGSEGIGIRGGAARVTNEGSVIVSGTDSEGVGIEGDAGSILNLGSVSATGGGAEGFVIEGDSGLISNFGTVAAAGFQAEAVGIEGSGAIRNFAGGVITAEGIQAIAIGALGDGIEVSSSGIVGADGSQAVGIGILGNGTALALGADAQLVALGDGAFGAALAGGGSDSSATLFRGTGASVAISDSVSTSLDGTGATGYLVFHDNALFSGFGELRGSGDESTGFYFAGDSLDAELAGALELSGARSTGVAVGTARPLTPGADSDNGVLSLGGRFALLGDQSVAVDIAGSGHDITNDAILETAESGTGVRMTGSGMSLTNTGSAEIRKGGVVVGGDDMTLVNEGTISGKGILVESGSGTINATNIGVIDVGEPGAYGVTQLAGFEFRGGGGTVRNEGTVTGLQDTVGLLLGDVTEKLTIENTGTLETDVAIAGLGGPELTITNEGTIRGRAGIGIADGVTASVSNSGTMEINAVDLPSGGPLPDALGVQLYVNDSASFVNAGVLDVSVGVAAASGAVTLGVSGGGTATLLNQGTIAVEGAGTVSGVRLLADNVRATNELDTDISVRSGGGSEFWAIGLNAFNDAILRNDGTLLAVGGSGRGVGLRAESSDTTFQLVNSGRIEASGGNAVGMKVEATSEMSTFGGIVPRERVIANEDTLVISGEDSRGMVLDPFVNATRLENAGRFDVAGDGARGIEVKLGAENFVLNANGFRVAGENAVGIAISGDRNTIMNGQDSAVFPDSGVLVTPDGFYAGDAGPLSTVTVIDAFIDIADSKLGNVPVTGDLVVTGPGAIGIDVNGDGNRIANLPGYGRAGDLPALGEGTPIFAQGAGSIGVRMAGTGNWLLNEGTVTGESFAILDGAGSNTFINGGYLFGDVDLGGGDDALVVREGARLAGTAHGGAGTDQLIAAMRNPDPGDPVGVGTLNADQYQGFESFEKVGDNTLILDGTLNVLTAGVRRGELRLAPGAEITGETSLSPGTVLTGSGVLGGLTILEDARGAPGTSAGRWDIAGDLAVLGGILDLEIGATPAGSDLIVVDGVALFDAATIRLSFLDGFLPSVDDLFEVIVADTLLGFDSLSFDVLGLGDRFDLVPTLVGSGRLAFLTAAAGGGPAPVSEPSTLVLLLGSLLVLTMLGRARSGRR